ncbi:HAD family hydrolase [Spirulina sp. CS-785/01]|uniref:HAD-IA family hydrolase n=1 Tax=Spirulina sp. CS-785/01 TaxID=3021716 RepID=UPI00232B4010|nr:HAD family hydrolase [Spirulina sp. CS-785/01]MDB9315889.1 HAD family hydrolase [Spirulina sp. CS-785/01]
MSQPKPKVIFLDAVGTLFGVKGSVGEVYGMLAQEFGVTAPIDSINTAFYDSFKASPPLAFPDIDIIEVPDQEYQWWEAIVKSTFEQVGVLDQFKDFDTFFNQLYGYFATAQPWYVYPDILPTLEKWLKEDIELGIISNFDSRLHAVLEVLELGKYFSSVTISSALGFAKPSPDIFAKALSKHHCNPDEAWHIGDSVEHDYQGAKAAGVKAFLIKR